jgi:predicted  nucleic acid-binding Zn-ribbon protein
MNDIIQEIDRLLERNGWPTNGTESDILKALKEALDGKQEKREKERDDLYEEIEELEYDNTALESRIEKLAEFIKENGLEVPE